MILFGKELKPETATMWVNIIGFMASLIFYLKVGHSFTKPTDVPINPLQSEVVKIDSMLRAEVSQLKQQQDSLLRVITAHEIKLEQTQGQVHKQKTKLSTTLHSDWDTLTPQQREDYTKQLIVKLKNKKP